MLGLLLGGASLARAEKVPIQILEDQAGGRGGIVNVSKNVNAFSISPDGKRAAFGARGEVFTVPVHSGPTRNLTNTPGVAVAFVARQD